MKFKKSCIHYVANNIEQNKPTIFENRVAIIGDIHGESKKLNNLLDKIKKTYSNMETIFCTGDLIDRGPDSKGVVQTCIDNNIVSIRGNHDDLLIRFLFGEVGAFSLCINQGIGGFHTVKSYGINPYGPNAPSDYRQAIPDSHKSYLTSMPMMKIFGIESNSTSSVIPCDKIICILTHAGLGQEDWPYESSVWKDYYRITSTLPSPGIKRRIMYLEKKLSKRMESIEDTILWSHKRNQFLDLNITPKKNIGNTRVIQVVGHTPTQDSKPTLHSNNSVWSIDTGCGKHENAPLSALILPDETYIQSDNDE